MITHSEMVRRLGKDGKNILQTLTPEKCHVWHMSSCIMGEVGELVEGVLGGNYTRANVVEELGDIEFYMEGLRDGVKIVRDEVLSHTRGLARADTGTPTLYQDGLVIHAANIFDACKKWIIYEKDIDRDKLVKAMAKFEWFMSAFRGAAGITYSETIEANIEKLARRYGSDFVYTNQKAQDRADKQ